MMKRALAESERADAERKKLEIEEEEMMRQVMEASMRDDNDRQNKIGMEMKLSDQLAGVSAQEAALHAKQAELERKEREL